ncbi:MAG: hypothetical protein PHN82_07490 [bacterium]|nr:hypothetical protein [bacterium]
MKLFAQISIVTIVAAIACTQVFLLCKYLIVSRTLSKMQETSSGDHKRFRQGNNHNVRPRSNGR